jgi:hypothetical protein
MPLRLATLLFASAGMVGLVVIVTGYGTHRLFLGAPFCLVAAMSALAGRFALRRRARREILSWLPVTRVSPGAERPWGGDWEGLWSPEDAPAGSELSAGLRVARTEIRDATRALLASLGEEARSGGPRRGARPACRHARLRELGRRVVVRAPASAASSSRRHLRVGGTPGRKVLVSRKLLVS